MIEFQTSVAKVSENTIYLLIQWTGTHQKRLNGNTYLLYDNGDLRIERSH